MDLHLTVGSRALSAKDTVNLIGVCRTLRVGIHSESMCSISYPWCSRKVRVGPIEPISDCL